MFILFKFPSRNRPERFFKTLDSLYNNLSDYGEYCVSCTLDKDDLSMANGDVSRRIKEYNNISIEWGKSKSKVDAINRDVPNIAWDIMVIVSDDMLFKVHRFDELIRIKMSQLFPNGDGYLHFKEKDTQAVLNVMTIIDRKYYERFGYIYHPSYKSLWCDNEQTVVAKKLERYAYIPYEIFDHKCPCYSYPDYYKKDEMFERQFADWDADHANFLEREKINFGL